MQISNHSLKAVEVQNQFNDFWAEYEPYIRKLCKFKLNSMPHSIDDCVQETFKALLEALKKGKPIEHPKAWLTTVANNKIKNLYASEREKAKHIVSLSDESVINQPIEYINIVDEPLLSDEELLQYKQLVLGFLSKKEKQLFNERYEKKYETHRIAAIYGTSENNIYQRLYRLRKKVIDLIHEYTDI